MRCSEYGGRQAKIEEGEESGKKAIGCGFVKGVGFIVQVLNCRL